MDVLTDPVLVEIEELRAQVKTLNERIAYLHKLRSSPTVDPVLVYWRHKQEYREPLDSWEWDRREPLRAAYEWLETQSDMGECSPEGVEVNGVFYDFDKLREMYDPRPVRVAPVIARYLVETTMTPGVFAEVPEYEYRNLQHLKILRRGWLLPDGATREEVLDSPPTFGG